jgi:hypothetical protein
MKTLTATEQPISINWITLRELGNLIYASVQFKKIREDPFQRGFFIFSLSLRHSNNRL